MNRHAKRTPRGGGDGGGAASPKAKGNSIEARLVQASRGERTGKAKVSSPMEKIRSGALAVGETNESDWRIASKQGGAGGGAVAGGGTAGPAVGSPQETVLVLQRKVCESG